MKKKQIKKRNWRWEKKKTNKNKGKNWNRRNEKWWGENKMREDKQNDKSRNTKIERREKKDSFLKKKKSKRR